MRLYEALHPKGLRTPLWGTLSGLYASIGGGMSQNGLFWGARERHYRAQHHLRRGRARRRQLR